MPDMVLTMHPASEGDCLLLSWGTARSRRRLLVDFGRTGDYRRLRPTLAELKSLELLVISHIDADHIEGAVPFFEEQTPPCVPAEVWFNGWKHLEAAKRRLEEEHLGAKQGEKVSVGIERLGWRWNSSFASGVVSTGSPEASAPIRLKGGLALQLVSPTDRRLADLIPQWQKEIIAAGLRPGDTAEGLGELPAGKEKLSSLNVEALAAARFKEDTSRPNGSSIGFIASRGSSRILLTGDAYDTVLQGQLKKLGAATDNRFQLDCLKLSHHGSQANLSLDLLNLIECPAFAISTDGSRHDHPDAEAIARVLKSRQGRGHTTLYFNHRHHESVLWDDADLMRSWDYSCVFPPDNDTPLSISFG